MTIRSPKNSQKHMTEKSISGKWTSGIVNDTIGKNLVDEKTQKCQRLANQKLS